MNLTARAPLAQSRSRVCKMTDQTGKRKEWRDGKKTACDGRSGLDTYLLHTVLYGLYLQGLESFMANRRPASCGMHAWEMS